MKIKGQGSYISSAGIRYEVKGIGSLPDDTSLQSLKVSGSFECGKISCNNVNVSGKIEGNSIHAKNFSLSGKIEVNCIIADEIAIDSRSGSINELKCAKIKISNRMSEKGVAFFEKIFGEHSTTVNINSRVHIKNIEAENVHLENCAVDIIRCQDAFIGTNCVIEKLFVAGECKVADDSTVGETIRV